MRVNESTAIVGDRVVLVPYRPEHVPTYHQWMKDPELLKLTASEPLTFEEELDMQTKWQEDDDKLTFIVLARPDVHEDIHNPLDAPITLTSAEISTFPMAGDVNMFFNLDAGEVECEVMIAESAYQRKGLGLEALQLLLRYATSQSIHTSSPSASSPLPIDPTSLLVRIGASNHSSAALFAKLGFTRSKYVQAFDEVEMRFAWINQGSDGEGTHLEAEQVEELVEDRWGTEELEIVHYDPEGGVDM